MRTQQIGHTRHGQGAMRMPGVRDDSLRNRLPIERIFLQVAKREMTADERRILIGNTNRARRTRF
jgi:hypothetical protein